MNEQIPTQEDMDEHLQSLATSILKKRDDAIEARASCGIERKWREAQRAFDGIDGTVSKTDMLDFATGDAWMTGQANQAKRSKVIVNIIRGKCETAEGRFSEIQLPTDDRNWGLLNTKVSEASVKEVPQQGMVAQEQQPAPGQQPAQQPAQPVDQAKAKKDDLDKRCAAMEEEIDDQLSESGFNGECRKVVRSAIRLGTGVLKGPSVIKSTRKAWVEKTDQTGTVFVMNTVENIKPASKWVDCWNVYPDRHCGNDIQKGAYIWERDHILPREIKNLIGIPGYNSRQLALVLQEEPVRTAVTVNKGNNNQITSTSIGKGSPYEKWEYHGDVDRDDMAAMGCYCPDDLGPNISACIVFINNRPVKAVRNTLDTGDLPYDFFQWVETDDDLPWGMGEPLKLIWQQRIITAAWREMMNNAGASSGATLVMGKAVIPEDGDWTVQGNKIWIDESEEGDVKKAFAQFQTTNNQAELANIINLALKFTDLESGTPALAQGEKGSAPETLGGMQLLMQGADTTRRHQVKMWDDHITRPHIGRYYHWNMQYNEKNEIKGDYEIDARGTSVLLVKDQAAQSLLQILQLRGDPEVNIQVDWGKTIRQLFKARHLDVLKTPEEVEIARKKQAEQPPPEDPRIAAAKIAVEGKLKSEEMETKQLADRTVAEARMALERQNHEARENTEDRKDTADELKAKLADTVMKLKMQERLAAAAQAQVDDHAVAQHRIDLHLNKQVATPQVAPGAVEPVGRAKNGQAFQG